MRNKPHRVPLTIKVKPADREALERMADARETTRSALAAQAIREFLNRYDKEAA